MSSDGTVSCLAAALCLSMAAMLLAMMCDHPAPQKASPTGFGVLAVTVFVGVVFFWCSVRLCVRAEIRSAIEQRSNP